MSSIFTAIVIYAYKVSIEAAVYDATWTQRVTAWITCILSAARLDAATTVCPQPVTVDPAQWQAAMALAACFGIFTPICVSMTDMWGWVQLLQWTLARVGVHVDWVSLHATQATERTSRGSAQAGPSQHRGSRIHPKTQNTSSTLPPVKVGAQFDKRAARPSMTEMTVITATTSPVHVNVAPASSSPIPPEDDLVETSITTHVAGDRVRSPSIYASNGADALLAADRGARASVGSEAELERMSFGAADNK